MKRLEICCGLVTVVLVAGGVFGGPVAKPQTADPSAIFFPPDDPNVLTFEDILAMGPRRRTSTTLATTTTTVCVNIFKVNV